MSPRVVVDPVPRQRALTVLSLMRTERMSLTRAAREAGTRSGTVRRYVGRALRRAPTGRYQAVSADRFTRVMNVLTSEGERTLTLRGSRVASLAAAHNNAVRQFLATGDESALRRFAGKTVAGHRLETRPDVIERLGRRGELAIEDIYPRS